MPFVPAPALTTRCALNFTQNGEACANVIYVARGALSVQECADDLFDIFATQYAPTLNNNCSFDTVVARDVETSTGLMAISSGASVAGTAMAQALSNDKAECISLHTGLGGRSGRGRFYTMGMTIGDITDTDPNHITTARQAARLSTFQDIHSDISGAGMTWVVASYVTDHAPRDEAVVNAVSSISVDRRIDTQRRRLPKN